MPFVILQHIASKEISPKKKLKTFY